MKYTFAIIYLLIAIISYGQQRINTARINYDTIFTDGASSFILPKVILTNKQVEANINKQLTIESITERPLQELLNINKKIEMYHEEGMWPADREPPDDGVFNIFTEVKKNDASVLSLQVCVTEIAAIVSAVDGTYPSKYYFLNFDLNTGDQICLDTIIKQKMMPRLLHMVNQKLRKNFRDGKRKYSKEMPYAYSSLNVDLVFSNETIHNFYIDDKGIVFYFDFHFFHCNQQWEPDNFVLINKRRLRSLISKHQYGL